jgi:hypothetical protein
MLWQAKYDLWQMVENYACFIEWKDKDRAAAARELQELGRYLRKWQGIHADQLHPRTGSLPIRTMCNLVHGILDTIAAQPNQ